jgi:hypothetical protein
MSTRFVFVTFGPNDMLHVQAWYAMLSIIAHAPAGTDLVMVTDSPDRYRWFGNRVRVLPIDAATIRRWRGPHDYLWRVKFEAMRAAAALGPEPVVYCDCDVVARADLARMVEAIDLGAVFMHHREIALGDMRRRSMRPLQRHVVGRAWAGIPVVASDAMWNAGVVGVRDHALIDRAESMSDELLDSGFQHSLYEQLAFSLTLANTGRLQPADAWTVHYWDNKEGWCMSIAERVAAMGVRGLSVDDAAEAVRSDPINRPVSVRKRWWNRYFKTLAGADC